MWHRGLLSIFSVILFLAVCTVEAAEKKKKAKPAQAAPVASPVKSEADLAQEKLHDAWIAKLDGAWSLKLRPPTPEQGSPQQDTLTFTGRRVESDMLKQEGSGGSNFTLTPQDDQVAVWETMQITPAGDRVLWRGEVRDAAMSGILSRQPKEGEASTWSFTGTKGPTTPVTEGNPESEVRGTSASDPDVSKKALTP